MWIEGLSLASFRSQGLLIVSIETELHTLKVLGKYVSEFTALLVATIKFSREV